MKRHKSIIEKTNGLFRVALIIVLLALSSCYKVSHNGDLDGMWRVISIESVETGKESHPDQIFYCFDLSIAQLTRGYIVATANMVYHYPEIKLDFPNQRPEVLADWGIYATYVEFEILKLNGSSLVIKSDDSIVTMTKF